jgi:ketosteroid isomerase-like protein
LAPAQQPNIETVHRACDAFNRGDLDGMLAEISPEFEYVTAGTIPDLSGTYRGTDRFEAFVRRFWEDFEDARLDIHEVVDRDDAVMVSMTMLGRGKQSSAETSWEVFQVWTMRDGKAIRGQGFTGRDEAVAALRTQRRADAKL